MYKERHRTKRRGEEEHGLLIKYRYPTERRESAFRKKRPFCFVFSNTVIYTHTRNNNSTTYITECTVFFLFLFAPSGCCTRVYYAYIRCYVVCERVSARVHDNRIICKTVCIILRESRRATGEKKEMEMARRQRFPLELKTLVVV